MRILNRLDWIDLRRSLTADQWFSFLEIFRGPSEKEDSSVIALQVSECQLENTLNHEGDAEGSF